MGRNGGSWYTSASGAALFELPKPSGLPIGWEGLPEVLTRSSILTGNDLGKLAHAPECPDLAAMPARPGDPAGAEGLERALQAALARDDLGEAWRLAGRRLACG